MSLNTATGYTPSAEHKEADYRNLQGNTNCIPTLYVYQPHGCALCHANQSRMQECSVHNTSDPTMHTPQRKCNKGQTGSTHKHKHKEWHATATCPIVCSLILKQFNNCQLFTDTLQNVLYMVGRPYFFLSMRVIRDSGN